MSPCVRIVVAMAMVEVAMAAQDLPDSGAKFDPQKDLISLHYDHAPDKDDGHSAAADRTMLQVLYGADWIRSHVLAVSGAHGRNAGRFNPKSDAVMDACWNDAGGWVAAHERHAEAAETLAERWSKTLADGGDVWVKEGGQSDLTARVVQLLKQRMPEVDTAKRIHVVQHSNWNENQTTKAALAYTKQHTDYIRLRDANRYLNVKGGDAKFIAAANDHPVFGAAWREAFGYYNPKHRLDFSDTGELMRITGLGELGIDEFRKRFLDQQ